AAKTMRNVIADHFRYKKAVKRTSDGCRVYLDNLLDQLASQKFEFSDLDAALDELEELAPRQAEVVQMKFFFGMTMNEIADKLQISLSSVEADWRKARAWLFKELSGG
ncbi:MAG: sigma-70 family RNA polymerase sigma factor, partial [Planctomycetota bacterium]